jgi:shikimate dehydrogenase
MMDAPSIGSDGGAAVERVVLIGDNIAHSRSPRIHNHLFERFALPLRYELMPLASDDVLPALELMKREGYRGANVTSPHKQRVMAGLDRLSDEAARIGAVNTILFEDGKAIGHNTDTAGFARSLAGVSLLDSPFSAAILGTGGAALAALYVLLALPSLTSLVLYSRDPERARAIAWAWDDARLRGDELARFAPADLVVHATPVGLAGDRGSLLTAGDLRGSALLYEMIYSPAETPLLREAARAGMATIGGAAMFIGQAARAFELWTGIAVDERDMPGDLFTESRT